MINILLNMKKIDLCFSFFFIYVKYCLRYYLKGKLQHTDFLIPLRTLSEKRPLYTSRSISDDHFATRLCFIHILLK